ncbi:MAG: hypothetical protein DLM59_15595 [Pseudonocardiales bacterium]|nr:MAG: hypothetical protein DLM59_15595 [Pseudonocardiales bacterium]
MRSCLARRALFTLSLGAALLVSMSVSGPADAGASGIVFGASVAAKPGGTFTQAVADQDAAYGTPAPMPISRVFLNVAASWVTGDQAVSKRPVVVSFKYSPTSVLAHKNDRALKNFFSTAPTTYETYWSYIHEPEDNIERGEFTSADYRAAWTHIADLATAANNPHMHSTLILMCFTLNPASARDWHNYYAGSAAQSMIAFDCYNHAGKRNAYGLPSNIFKPITDWQQTPDAKDITWGISEVGSTLGKTDTGGALRAQWLRDVGAFLVNQHTVNPNHAIFAIYFDVVGPSGTDYRLTDANSQAAWREVVQTY